MSCISHYNSRFTTKTGRVITARFFWPIGFGACRPGRAGTLAQAAGRHQVALQDVVQQTVNGLDFDLVEIERSAGGVLRVTIDVPWQRPERLDEGSPAAAERFITVDDCEVVTRQLQFALEVEGVDYQRLEVSSPGIDRPLRHEADLERFEGELVDITLKAPIGAAAAGQVAANRKKFRGQLARGEAQGWQIVWSDAPAPKPGQRVSKKRESAPLQVLGFTWDEVREARLAPVVNFKGRAAGKATPGENA